MENGRQNPWKKLPQNYFKILKKMDHLCWMLAQKIKVMCFFVCVCLFACLFLVFFGGSVTDDVCHVVIYSRVCRLSKSKLISLIG